MNADRRGTSGPLAGVSVVESSLLGPGELTTFLADLGAEVIKVEPPQGDYVRRMTWPIVETNMACFLEGRASEMINLVPH